MANYHYKCQQGGCMYEFHTSHSIKADFLKDCPECKQSTLSVVIYAVPAFVRGEPKTLGALAERNTEKLGEQGRQDMWGSMNERKKLAKEAAKEELAAKLPKGASIPSEEKSEQWYRPGTTGPIKSLNSLTTKQAKKYIEEGKV